MLKRCLNAHLFIKTTEFSAPVLGWGRYETFEYGCTVAFHDPSFNLRSYVLFTFFVILMIPLGLCFYSYGQIIWYTYQCKLELFPAPSNGEDVGPVDPLQGSMSAEDQCKMDILIKQVDPNLLEALSLVERKLTRLTLVAALGFMAAWLPFSALCMWEMASPPTEIPTSRYLSSILFRVFMYLGFFFVSK